MIMGIEMYLYFYINSVDNKEYLVIVFGNYICSKFFDVLREGEIEMDRMVRGVYIGCLFFGWIISVMVGGEFL